MGGMDPAQEQEGEAPSIWEDRDRRNRFWDARFAEEAYVYGTEPNDFLREVGRRIPAGGRVLCLCEGEGRNAVWLAEQGYRVTAVDASREGLRKAERLAGERGVEVSWVLADLAEWPIEPDAWDGIVSIFAHLPPELRHHVHRSVAKGLAPGGALVLEAYTPAQLAFGTGGPPEASLMMTLEALRKEFEGLHFEIGREVERAIHEGSGHQGLSAVVQVLAVRPSGRGPTDS